MQNFLKAKERGIDVQLFVRKNKDEKISKEFYYLGRMISTGRIKEFKEELNTEVEVEGLLDTVEYDYPKLHLSMDCFICKIKSGDLVLKEHEAAKWLTKETLNSVEWLPAVQGLIEKIDKYLGEILRGLGLKYSSFATAGSCFSGRG